jgi:hypothetical protein
VRGFEEGYLHVVAKVVAVVAAAESLGAARPEQLVKNAAAAEDFPENLARVVESAGPRLPGAGAESRVAEAVVGGARLRVVKSFVRLAQLLKFLLGRLVVGIAVGMILERQLAVSLLDLLDVGIAVHAEDLVIIALGHNAD